MLCVGRSGFVALFRPSSQMFGGPSLVITECLGFSVAGLGFREGSEESVEES